jgi:hypothetical protein
MVVAFGCGQKSDSTEYVVEEEIMEESDEWPELDEFHMIMAESFHPYKDSLNIDPAKANAAEMANVASRWAEATLPSKVTTDEAKVLLAELKFETNEFSTLVGSGTPEEIGASLKQLHDTFHKIQELWYGGGEEHHEHDEEQHEEEH